MIRSTSQALPRLAAIVLSTLSLIVIVANFSYAVAQEPFSPLARPTGPVVLSITGDVLNINHDGRADFDMAMLMAMPSARISTTTPWTQGVIEFDGVPLQYLLDHVAAQGDNAEFSALNDYAVRIHLQDLSAYSALIAYRMNGEMMSVRNRGPLWLVLPLDDYPKLRTTFYRDRMIWQLRTINVKQ